MRRWHNYINFFISHSNLNGFVTSFHVKNCKICLKMWQLHPLKIAWQGDIITLIFLYLSWILMDFWDFFTEIFLKMSIKMWQYNACDKCQKSVTKWHNYINFAISCWNFDGFVRSFQIKNIKISVKMWQCAKSKNNIGK